MTERFRIGDAEGTEWNCSLTFPPQYDTISRRFPVVYLMGETDTEQAAELLIPHFDSDCEPFILAGIEGKDWNTTLPPWAAPKLGKNLGPFSGGGLQYLSLLEKVIKPRIDSSYRTQPSSSHTALAGYSLAGLLALYALYNSRTFTRFACMSGSLWFPGWIEYIHNRAPAAPSPLIYMSLGDSESHSRNRVMAEVENDTLKTFGTLSACHPFFEMNTGGHFDNVPQRIAKGILYLMHSTNNCINEERQQ
jgi:predicted alpha/beta superfamily hydrolase